MLRKTHKTYRNKTSFMLPLCSFNVSYVNVFFSRLVWGSPRAGLKGEKFRESAGMGKDSETDLGGLGGDRFYILI